MVHMLTAAQAPTVLVVDDESSVRAYMARVLEAEGYSVLEAKNGIEALSVLENDVTGKVLLVVTDVVMPHMDGMDLARNIASRPSAPPVLFVSGSHSEVPGPLLRKPFLGRDLSALARDLLEV
jgi:two-component system cell cycle sensor histidine kinase/response regulator CckA